MYAGIHLAEAFIQIDIALDVQSNALPLSYTHPSASMLSIPRLGFMGICPCCTLLHNPDYNTQPRRTSRGVSLSQVTCVLSHHKPFDFSGSIKKF